VPVDLVVVPTLDRGAVSGVVVSFRDLTERRAAERQAAELRRVQQEAATQRALADRLQDAMLTPPPTGGDLEIAVRYRAAVHEAHIGGDWYDAFVEPDGSTVLAIGDVVGHDSRAAVAMGQLRGLLRALAYDNGAGPAATLTRAEHVAGGLGVSTMATVLLARVEPAGRREGGRRLCWSNAGHLPPLLLRPDGSSAYLEAPPDLVLGIDPDTPREEHEAFLPDGATLLLCTDGLVERRDWDLDQGLATLRATVADLAGVPLEQFCDTVLRRLVPTAGADDVAMVAVRSRSGGHGRPSVTPGG
jgi:serine phosphatase RsbU (regulator of sigma subunit)